MTFWIGIIIALVVAVVLIRSSGEPSYVRQTNEAFGLVIGTVAVTLAVMKLL